MFDARKLLEAMLGGGAARVQPQAQAPAQAPGGGGLADILGQILGGGRGPAGQGGGAAAPGGGLEEILRRAGGAGSPSQGGQGQAAGAPQGGLSLEDLLRNLGGGGGEAPRQAGPRDMRADYEAEPQGTSSGRGDMPGTGTGTGATQGPAGGGQGPGGGLGDLLEQLQRQAGGAGGGAGGQGGIADILRQVLGQATQGAREGAGRIGEATGAREALERATGGQSADDLVGQLKDWVSRNQLGAGAAAGGLGAVILGTQTGRRMAGSALKLGALALIGGLAYKAYQNYQQGRPVIGGQQLLEAAPNGSGFDAQALTNETATLYIRAMIAAAAADGRLDESEQERILGSLRLAGADAQAQQFLDLEIQNPATVADLVAAVTTPEQAMQVYAAARIAVDIDTDAEKQFLAELANGFGIDAGLAAHVDALATGNA